jgi:hypothetical protein
MMLKPATLFRALLSLSLVAVAIASDPKIAHAIPECGKVCPLSCAVDIHALCQAHHGGTCGLGATCGTGSECGGGGHTEITCYGYAT